MSDRHARDLADARESIRILDEEIVRLLARRLSVVRRVGAIKRASGIRPVRDPERERERALAWARAAEAEGLPVRQALRLLAEIMRQSRRTQERRPLPLTAGPDRDLWKFGYQGEPLSYSDLAIGEIVAGTGIRHVASGFDDFARAADALESGAVDLVLLPIENSTVGRIEAVRDLLLDRRIFIVAEEWLPIDHALAALPGVRVEEIRKVRSHAVALAQCSKRLSALPDVVAEVWPDTAAAAASVAVEGDRSLAAICSEEAALCQGLSVLAERFADAAGNRTRFVLCGADPGPLPPAGSLRSTFVVSGDAELGSRCRSSLSALDLDPVVDVAPKGIPQARALVEIRHEAGAAIVERLPAALEAEGLEVRFVGSCVRHD